MLLRFYFLVWIGGMVLSFPVSAQEADGPLQDPFLDDLTGAWTMTGHVMGDSVRYDAHGKWTLNHQFLRFRMEDVNSPPEYVARVYIGYDREDQEYVAHWLDSSGGRPSETLGYGEREGRAVEFKFDYPDGPFRTTFEKRTGQAWHVLMRTKGEDGDWSTFAEYDVTPKSTP